MSLPGGPSIPILVVRAGAQLCALPVQSIVETLRPGAISPVRGAAPFIRGVTAIRGAAVPVVDLSALLGSGSSAQGTRLVVARAAARRVALWVDSVLGISHQEGTRLKDLPPLLADVRPELVEKIAMLDSQLLLVLRASRLVPEALAGISSAERPA